MLTHIGTQTIETERLILRRFEYSDIDSMLRNWIADEQTQWDYGEPYYPTSDDVQKLFDTKYIVSYSCKDYYRWAVIEKTSSECIGQIAFFLVDSNNQHGEIEYVIGPAFQGKGYATEMTKAVIRFGFEKINFHRIEIDCRTVNEASRRVIEKCGLTYEGTFRDFFWRKDHFEGRRVYSGSFANVGVSESNAVARQIRCVQHCGKSQKAVNNAKQSICFAVVTFRCDRCKADGFLHSGNCGHDVHNF